MSDAVKDTAEIVRRIREHLAPWVQAQRGALSVARDPFEVMEILSESPAGFRVIIAYEGDDTIEDVLEIGAAKHTLKVTVTHNRGMSILKGEALIEPRGDQKPLFELRDLCRAHLRSFKDTELIMESGRMAYGGTKPLVTPDGFKLDAYEMTFTLDTAITQRT